MFSVIESQPVDKHTIFFLLTINQNESDCGSSHSETWAVDSNNNNGHDDTLTMRLNENIAIFYFTCATNWQETWCNEQNFYLFAYKCRHNVDGNSFDLILGMQSA